MTTCQRCNRPLTNPKSAQAGMGPVCFAKQQAERGDDQNHDPGFQLPPTEDGAYEVRRGQDGIVRASVPRRCVEHSPTGYECGYGGSGPADLALNILEDYVRAEVPADRWGGLEPLVEGACTSLAWRLHHDFKWKFIAAMPREGGRISREAIANFVAEKLAAVLA